MLTLYPYPNCLPPILGYLKKKSYPIRCIHYSRIPILFPQPKRKDAPVLRHFLLIALCLMLTAPTTLAQETNNQDRALKQKATAIPGRFQVYKPDPPPASENVDFSEGWRNGPDDLDVADIVQHWWQQQR